MWCTKSGCPGSGSVQEKRILDPHFTHFGSFSRPLPLLSGILPHHMVAEVARQATLILSITFGNQPKFEWTWRCTLCAQRLWKPKLLDRQPRNLRRIADAGLSNLDDLLGDEFGERIVAVF
jgi:hypothetical protein